MNRFTVLYDACVLYPAPSRDLLLRLALTDFYRARGDRAGITQLSIRSRGVTAFIGQGRMTVHGWSNAASFFELPPRAHF